MPRLKVFSFLLSTAGFIASEVFYLTLFYNIRSCYGIS